MPLRKLLLRVLLISLGISAVTGAAAVLVGTGQTVWKVVGTGLVTAGAALVMLPCSLLADREKSRAAGLLGMAGVVGEYLLLVALIWDVPGPLHLWDEAGVTALLLPPAVLAGMICLRAARSDVGRLAGRVGTVATVLTFALLMAAAWAPGRWYDNDELWGTAWLTAALAPVGLACLLGAGRGDGRWWRWVGVTAAALAIAVGLVGIWADLQRGGGTFAVIVCVAAAVAYANVAALVPLAPGQRWLRWTAVAAAAATASFVATSALVSRDGFDPALRLAAATGIVAGCGGLALLVLARLNRRLDLKPTMTGIDRVAATCPACQRKQQIPVGDSACPTCGLQFHLRLTEPRCATCGYSLFMLNSDRCPECGTPAAAAAGAIPAQA